MGGRERAPRLPNRSGGATPTRESPITSARRLVTNLHAAENRIAEQSVEHLYAFASNGRLVMEKGGEAIRAREGLRGQAVYFTPSEYERMRGAVVTHNHPNGTSLSKADIRLASQHGFAQMRAVTRDHIFTLAPARGHAWPAWDGPAGMGAFYERAQAVLAAAWQQELFTGRVGFDEAQGRVVHGILDMLAKQYGLRYHVTSRHAGAARLPRS